jgi:serine O-acetyltransferase
VFARLREDVQTIFSRDPAARSIWEVLTYSGLHALVLHRVSHKLWNAKIPPRGFWKFSARLLSQFSRLITGIEIHPGARIGRRFFIDHGVGVVIGETAEIGDDVLMYHQVTLGGTSLAKVKRHPTIGNHVLIGMGAKIIGAVTIGHGCKIGANAVVNKDVPDNCTVVGVPGRIVLRDGYRIEDDMPVMDNIINRVDPQDEVIRELRQRVEFMEQHIEKLEQYLTKIPESEEKTIRPVQPK